MNTADIVRSLLLGQTMWTFVWLIVVVMMLRRQHLRPGIIIGLLLLSIGDAGALLYVLYNTLDRMGQPMQWRTWVALGAVLAESFGCVLIAAHLLCHDSILATRICDWFKDKNG